MKLEDFLKYDEITIQCHDNPDADALASAYGLYCFFSDKGKQTRLIYSGRSEIQKSNLKLMIDHLTIPAVFIPASEAETTCVRGLLITSDCQYGAGNVTKFDAEHVAIIDHHRIEIDNVKDSLIISDMGSCSTIVWKLLLEAGYEVNDRNHLSTALYYGLMTDTNTFAEMQNPIDRDMQDALSFDKFEISRFVNSNISLSELEIAGVAMLRAMYNEDHDFAIIQSQPCDPNVLGLISDFLLQVDRVMTCVVFNEISAGIKFSVRSCTREVNASELAAFLAEDIGSGGGHTQKAGGFIQKKLYDDKIGDIRSETYFHKKMAEYFEKFELVYAEKYEADLTAMKKYQKKSLPIGYAKPIEFLPQGTPITVRTLEGDLDLIVDDKLVIMIGIQGEVYPNGLEKFEKSYVELNKKYYYCECVIGNRYEPTIKNRLTGEVIPIAEHARVCVPSGKVQIYAKPLDTYVKVFTAWDKEKYMMGKPGDYIAVRTDDMRDVYAIDKEIFAITYEEC